MKVIKYILEGLGFDSVESMEIGVIHIIEANQYQNLAIRRIGVDSITVGYVDGDEDDPIIDPHVVFNTAGDRWKPISHSTHPLVTDDESGLHIEQFVARWNSQLRRQGYDV